MARPSLDRNVKYKALIRMLGLPRPYVRGLLETMWDVAHESGNPILGSPTGVEAAAEWPGEVGAWFQAVKECCLIDLREDGKWEIHDYWDHAPEYVKGRFRKEALRRRKRVGNIVSRDCRGTVSQKSDTPSPTPLLGEESPKNPSCPEPDEPASRLNEETPLLSFPVVGSGKVREWFLYPSKVAELGAAFPHLDVLAECRKSLAWVQANPTKTKTARGMGKYLFGWMSRAQDGGRGRKGPAETPIERLASAEENRKRVEAMNHGRNGGGIQALADILGGRKESP